MIAEKYAALSVSAAAKSADFPVGAQITADTNVPQNTRITGRIYHKVVRSDV